MTNAGQPTIEERLRRLTITVTFHLEEKEDFFN